MSKLSSMGKESLPITPPKERRIPPHVDKTGASCGIQVKMYVALERNDL